jgi:hypothetical protein
MDLITWDTVESLIIFAAVMTIVFVIVTWLYREADKINHPWRYDPNDEYVYLDVKVKKGKKRNTIIIKKVGETRGKKK